MANANQINFSDVLTSGVFTADNYLRGSGSPEGAVTASRGYLYQRTDVDTDVLYVKTTDGGNTGWTLVGGGGPSSTDALETRGQSYIIPDIYPFADINTPAEYASALQTAYTTAAAATPYGSAKSNTNRIAVLIPPGRYLFSDNFTVDTQFVDLIGLGRAPEDTTIEFASASHRLIKSANNVVIRNLTLRNTDSTSGTMAYQESGASTTTVLDSVLIETAATTPPTRSLDFAGNYRQVRSNGGLFSSEEGCTLSGNFEDCVGGPGSFGSSLTSDCSTITLSGSFLRCRGGGGSFGSIAHDSANTVTISGTLENCFAGDESFGYGAVITISGTLVGCRAGDYCFGSTADLGPLVREVTISGTLIDCVAGTMSFCAGNPGSDGGGLTISGKLINCVANGAVTFGAATAGFDVFISSTALIKGCVGTTDCFGAAEGGGSINFAGTVIDCKATDYSFGAIRSSTNGALTIASTAVIENCAGGQYSFGACDGSTNGLTISGLIRNCRGAANSFAFVGGATLTSLTLDGTFDSCRAGANSFMSTTNVGFSAGAATFINCVGGNTSFCATSSTGNITATSTVFNQCTGGNVCFVASSSSGALTATGAIFVNCTAGSDSFIVGNSGAGALSIGGGTQFNNCRGTSRCFVVKGNGSSSGGITVADCNFRGCFATDTAFFVITSSGTGNFAWTAATTQRLVACTVNGSDAFFRNAGSGTLPVGASGNTVTLMHECSMTGSNGFLSTNTGAITTANAQSVFIQDCNANSNAFGHSVSGGVNIASIVTFRDCSTITSGGFGVITTGGSTLTFTGTCFDCSSSTPCFCTHVGTGVATLNGVMQQCSASGSTGAFGISGTANNGVMSGLMVGCVTTALNGLRRISGTLINCYSSRNNAAAIDLLSGARIYGGRYINIASGVAVLNIVNASANSVYIHHATVASNTGGSLPTNDITSAASQAANIGMCTLRTAIAAGVTNGYATPENLIDANVR